MSRCSRQGAIFTIDALIALGAVFSVVLALTALLHQVGGDRSTLPFELLSQSAADIGAVLESSGRLTSLVSGDADPAQAYVDALGPGICADLALSSSGGVRLDSVRRTGCAGPDADAGQIGLSRRIVPAGDASYLVEVRAWFP